MKIHAYDDDPRQVTDAANYASNHGPFADIAINLNKEFQKMGIYAEPDDADFVGLCDGLKIDFQYKDKTPFLIHVWETSNSLPYHFLAVKEQHTQLKLFGLADQITNLWHKYGFNDVKTIYGGCDTNFWQQSKDKNTQFTFLHINSSNVRSGLDISINAFALAFRHNPDVKLVIKDTNNSQKLLENIRRAKEYGLNIEYISERMSSEQIRDLYSSSHVCLNLLRITSFGMPLLESSACNCLCVTGDIAPTNELIRPEYGVLIPPKGELSIFGFAPVLVKEWGLLNCYPNLAYPEPPRFYTYDVNNYAEILKNIYQNWSNFSTIDIRTPIIKNWQWRSAAEKLVKYLNES